ncbi:neuropeptide S receptor-like [Mercenaria mercenaria]|uniref:neuropeptide S receptor-like n=1 Tax=Mercenaria mercenaria TaxID=6596 RepID=UPI00234FAF00|nr:neuropeptide S receptor-like [Mercenaria mercenaria]XP_045180969.2 neuropeptide S receptor-like [Mercenaria mercenaria]XP_045180970.2 neuropeptide S receptor-like [Mercenaria mercenaria]XP_045180971.2 neuropeptide S receptor-like [Mercenaria mercenaria]
MELNDSDQSNVTTVNEVVFIRDGKTFEDAEKDQLKIFIWPLIFTFIFAVLGFIGNSIVIYIYWRKWKKNKTRVFILTLAMLDWLNCVFNMPVEIAVLWHPLSFDLHYLCKISRGCTFFINNTGSLVLVSIAIERYILVYYPLKSRQLTPKFAKGMCLLAFTITSVFSWPSFVFYGSHTLTIPFAKGVNVVGKTCLIADEHEFRTGLLLIFTTVLFALLVLTFVVLIVLYIAIGRKIYIATCTDITSDGKEEVTSLFSKSIISAITGVAKPTEMKRNSISRHTNSFSGGDQMKVSKNCQERTLSSINEAVEIEDSKKNTDPDEKLSPLRYKRNSRKFSTVKTKPTRKNTVMMRMVTIAFMVSFTPFLCILIIRYSNPKYYFGLDKSGKIAYHVFLRTYFINSMVNPFIYGFMNLHFRKLVKELLSNVFCSKCCRRN